VTRRTDGDILFVITAPPTGPSDPRYLVVGEFWARDGVSHEIILHQAATYSARITVTSLVTNGYLMPSLKTLVWEAPRVMNVRERDGPKFGATGFEPRVALYLLSYPASV
jgi:hypothetical protein